MDKLIPVDKLLKFTKSKRKFTWRWNHKFYIKNKATLFIGYGYTDKELPESLQITFKYIDISKDIFKNQNIESDVVIEKVIPRPKAVGKSEMPVSFDIKNGNKILWKISIKTVTKKENSFIYFKLGE